MRHIQILYFARVKEKLNYSIESLHLPDDIQTVADLKNLLAQRGDAWAEIFFHDKNLRAAINHALVEDMQEIFDQDEVAFFPPVSGG